MNLSIIRYVLGSVIKIEAGLLLLPCLCALLYGEIEGLWYLAVAAGCLLLGMLLTFRRPRNHVFYIKEGCAVTALSWLVLSLLGCLPFILTGEIPSFTDALFETVSGFTTTGASILNDIEALSQCSLLWRSFTHWIGGMGVLVFLLAVIPLAGGSHINLLRAESPGPSVGKLMPKIRKTARTLYLIYFGLTVLQIVLLLIAGMPAFEAVTTGFGTAGTGGFAVKNTSLMEYSHTIQWIVTIFMVLFGVNFNAFYFMLLRQFKKAFSIEEVRCYLIIIAAAIGIIFLNIIGNYETVGAAFTAAAFQVCSIITTTGFSTVDFNAWSQTCRAVLVLLMFIGACAGSTGGGLKVSRIMVMFKSGVREISSYIYPKRVKGIKLEGKPVEPEVVHGINTYLIVFLGIYLFSVLLVSIEGKDLITNLTAVAATINNIGPGLELVGPMGNFSVFSGLTKYVLMFDMLAGRLELFPLLLLFHPGLWKGSLRLKRKSPQPARPFSASFRH